MFKGISSSSTKLNQWSSSRGYRPEISLSGFEAKILKPQNIAEMLHMALAMWALGRDWVMEKQADVVELLDTGLDIKIVTAAPRDFI